MSATAGVPPPGGLRAGSPTTARRPRDPPSSWALPRLGALVILGLLAIFLFVKLAFRMPHSNAGLWAYGVTVTAVVLTQMFFAFARYRDYALEPAAIAKQVSVESPTVGVPEPPAVSCIVAVHNEEVIIDQCVRSLVSQTYEPLEIIIVDDASTDTTPTGLGRLAEQHHIKVITLEHNVGKKRALAVGMLHACGELFAFSDSDSVWAPDAVERTVGILVNHPEVGAVSGHCRALNADLNIWTKVQDAWYEGQFSVRKAFESCFGAVTCVSGPLAVFRREAIFNYIPAWEDDTFLGGEFRFATDRTLTGFVLMTATMAADRKRLHANSPFLATDYPWRPWQTVYSKSARAWTAVPDTFGRLAKQQIRWKKSFIRNIFFTGRFYWRRPFMAALLYYLHIAFVLVGPFVAFRHLVYMPLHGNFESMILYLFGIFLIGSMFGLAFRLEDPNAGRWFYRPFMSLLSTTVLCWLLFYSMFTIKKKTWVRG